jgi:proteasome lid subunit RPN8/RPN11
MTGESARTERIVPLANVADEAQRRRRFVIEPIAMVKLERELRKSGEQLVGFYHSHPDHPAEPSVTDLEYFRLWPRTIWLIIPVAKGQPGIARAWWLEGSDAAEATELELVSEARPG